MSSAVDLKTKEEKDAELDKRIEALRKKNEALMKRYKEIEEDKKKAEQEGIAVTTARKPRPHEPEPERRRTEKENIIVTVDLSKSSGDNRVVNDRKSPSHPGDHGPEEGEGERHRGKSPSRRGGSGRLNRAMPRGGSHRIEKRDMPDVEGEEFPARSEHTRGGRRGARGGTQPGFNSDRKSKEWEQKRKENIEKMKEEMEKIAEYERGERIDREKNPTRNFLDDPRRSGPVPEMDRKDGSRRHVRNWGGLDFDNVKTGAEEKEWTSRRPGGRGSLDMTLSMTGRERAEYLRWKKEREQIDEARLARHRNATGQWRREWDAQKTETMFSESTPAVTGEAPPEASSKKEDNKRPPKAPTFGDFLGQNVPREGGHGGRGRGRARGQGGKSYSMHDNRWEPEKEEEKGKKEEQEKEKPEKEKPEKEKPEKEKPEKEKPKTHITPKVPPKEKRTVEVHEKPAHAGAEVDDDEWEDASEGDEDEVEECEEDEQSSMPKTTEKSQSPPAPSTPSPKEQRTPRPKVHIPSPSQDSLTTPESTKPLSPFSLLESHQPVSDWGEEMEMLSPKSSLGESPLKPSSNESSPAQNRTKEENSKVATNSPEQPDRQQDTKADESAAPAVELEQKQSEGESDPDTESKDQPSSESEAPVIKESVTPQITGSNSSSSEPEYHEVPAQQSNTHPDESAAPAVELEQKQSESESDPDTESKDQPSSEESAAPTEELEQQQSTSEPAADAPAETKDHSSSG